MLLVSVCLESLSTPILLSFSYSNNGNAHSSFDSQRPVSLIQSSTSLQRHGTCKQRADIVLFSPSISNPRLFPFCFPSTQYKVKSNEPREFHSQLSFNPLWVRIRSSFYNVVHTQQSRREKKKQKKNQQKIISYNSKLKVGSVRRKCNSHYISTQHVLTMSTTVMVTVSRINPEDQTRFDQQNIQQDFFFGGYHYFRLFIFLLVCFGGGCLVILLFMYRFYLILKKFVDSMRSFVK